MSLPHSDGIFVKAYPGETTEAFCDGHVSAFRFLGGVPQSVLYDNTKLDFQHGYYFVMSLPHSDGIFVKAYPGETTEAFCDGHVSAFRFLGGVPQSVLYDNTKLAVSKLNNDIYNGRSRCLFLPLQVQLTWI